MSLKVSDNGGGEYKKVPEGVHVAVCTAVYDLGTQEVPDYNDKTKVKHQKKVLIIWQIPDERISTEAGALPMTIRKQYTASLDKKANLPQDLEALRGRAFTAGELKSFDLKTLLAQELPDPDHPRRDRRQGVREHRRDHVAAQGYAAACARGGRDLFRHG